MTDYPWLMTVSERSWLHGATNGVCSAAQSEMEPPKPRSDRLARGADMERDLFRVKSIAPSGLIDFQPSAPRFRASRMV